MAACTDGVTAERIDEELELDEELDGLLELVPAPEHGEPPAPPIEPFAAREFEDDEDESIEWVEIGYGDPKGPAQLVFDEDHYAGPCDFGVKAQALPAVDRERELVANLEFEGAQGPTDWDTSVLALVWRDFDDNIVERELVYDSDNLAKGDPHDAPRVYCARARETIEARVPELNAMLDARPLVPMIRQPVQTTSGSELHAEPPLARVGEQRPVEMLYNNGELIARVRGMKVLERVAKPSWQGEMGMMDAYNPNIGRVFGDREMGVAVVEYDYESASCMSDTQIYAGVVRMSEELFGQLELRQHLAVVAVYR